MLEVVVGVVAGLLIVAGLAIILGPTLARGLGLAGRRGRRWRMPSRPRRTIPSGELHPTTVKALSVANRLGLLLKEHGMERQAAAVRHATRRLQEHETDGIYAMQEVLRRLRAVRLGDPDDQEIFEGLAGQLRKSLSDRAEQLELLPRS